MDYLIAAINAALDKLLEVKGYVTAKKILEDRPKPKFTDNVIDIKIIYKEWEKLK